MANPTSLLFLVQALSNSDSSNSASILDNIREILGLQEEIDALREKDNPFDVEGFSAMLRSKTATDNGAKLTSYTKSWFDYADLTSRVEQRVAEILIDIALEYKIQPLQFWYTLANNVMTYTEMK